MTPADRPFHPPDDQTSTDIAESAARFDNEWVTSDSTALLSTQSLCNTFGAALEKMGVAYCMRDANGKDVAWNLLYKRHESENKNAANTENADFFSFRQPTDDGGHICLWQPKSSSWKEKSEETLLAQAVSSIDLGIAVFDQRGGFIVSNDSYRQLFPFTLDLMQSGVPYSFFLARALRTTIDESERVWVEPLIARKLPMSEVLTGSLLLRCRNGSWIRMEERLSHDGVLTSLWSDATALLESEIERARLQSRMRDAIESLTDGFALFDANDSLDLHNTAYLERYGLPEDVSLLGKTHEEILRLGLHLGIYADAPSDPKQADAWLDALRQRHVNPNKPFELRLNNNRWLRVSETKTQDGGVVGTHSDITIEVETKNKAITSNQAKNSFMANVSHELRTPLNAVIGFSEMILQESFGPISQPEYIDFVQDIYDSGQQLLSIINDVLEMARIETGEHQLNQETVDLAELVLSCLSLVRARAMQAEIDISYVFEEEPFYLFADRRSCMTVILHLLSNAIKFTHSGGAARATLSRANDGGALFILSDTGVGIDPNVMDLIFEPFHQADGRLGREHGGIGLGLSISKALIDCHNGQLDIKSEVNVGTTVTVYLPPQKKT
ncbi:hypothetical protein CCP2SC5_90003 [Azospirillaceae bacterium]